MKYVTRFLSRIDLDFDGDPCWEWQAGCNRNGYGQMSYNGRPVGAHRIAWEIENGPIPDGLQVLHKCDNRKCVNPNHLFLGTRDDNMADMMAKGRQRYGFGSYMTDEQVEAIRNDPRSIRVVAREYGISRSTVGHYRTGRRRA